MYNPIAGICGYSLGYFMLGGIMFKNREILNKMKYKIIAIVVLPLSMALLFLYGVNLSKNIGYTWDIVFNGYDVVCTLAMVISLFVLTLGYKANNWITKSLTVFGKDSLGIYLIHIPIGTFLIMYYNKLGFDSFLANLIFAFVVLLVSYGLVFLIKKIPILKKTVSL
jgi:surface polysaccharide O-acyltransferase-like enzyme